jgi:hypothetical protein
VKSALVEIEGTANTSPTVAGVTPPVSGATSFIAAERTPQPEDPFFRVEGIQMAPTGALIETPEK